MTSNTNTNTTPTRPKVAPQAGDVIHDVPHSPHWDPYDTTYGVKGGSPTFPDRSTVEARIKPEGQILQLRNPEVRIEPTNHCNYECVMCPRELHTRPQGIMPMAFYHSVVEEVIKMGAKQITLVNYGEPFLDPTLEDKIWYATQRGLSTYIITNASLFHLRSKSQFAKDHKERTGETLTKGEACVLAGLSQLRLSFYGTSPRSYETVMKGGDYERTRQNILDLVAYREKIGKRGTVGAIESFLPQLSIYFIELEENQDELQEFLDFTQGLCDYVEAWKPHNFGDGRHYRDVPQEELKSCGRPFNGPIQINWNGIVVPCCYDYNQAVPLGNVAQQTVEEVVRGTPYEKLREAHREGKWDMVPYCKKCDQIRCHNKALIYSNNPKHNGRTMEDIMKSPNTMAEFRMGVENK